MSLSIALIYPELLGTYGDRGNALVLAHRARARSIDVEIVAVSPGDILPNSADIYLFGGGEDSAQKLATELLRKQISTLKAVMSRAQFIAICAGFQILGKHFPVANQKLYEGLDIIDITTKSGAPRIIGEVITDATSNGLETLTGFENHAGRTLLGSSAIPLGTVIVGRGNGIEVNGSFVDGYFSDNIIGTYLHGPLFARNPHFSDYVLARACGIEPGTLPVINDDPAIHLHAERISSIS